VALFFILGISFSRLYLGYHDLENVLGGALVGTLLLSARLLQKRSRRGCGGRWSLAALFLFPAALILLRPGDGAGGKAFFVAGFYLAWLVGRQLEKSRVLFEPAIGWNRISGSPAGFIILILFAHVFRYLLIKAGLTGNAAPFFGGASIGFATTVLVPWILIRLWLFRRSNSRATSGPMAP